MSTATMTSKGQITIPISVRNALGVKTGDRVEFIEIEKGRFAVVASTLSVQCLKGMVPKPSTPVSLEDMDLAIGKAGERGK